MISFPNAKINIGLHITEKRSDGFHDLETVFYPVAVSDALELIEVKTLSGKGFDFQHSGLGIPGKGNICTKAFTILSEKFPLKFKGLGVKAHLHKTIPIGAGLGGGSSDGSFMLKMLNEKLQLNLSTKELEEIASGLGSDCPFFIQNIPVFAAGRGNIFENVGLSLKKYFIHIVFPEVPVNTAWAYSQITPKKPEKDLKDLIRLPVSEWKDSITNDFEEPVFKSYPELKSLKEKIYSSGALYASMSGSGSAFFGIYNEKQDLRRHFPGMKCW